MAFTWLWETGEIAGVKTMVELRFNDVDDGTEMILKHRSLPTKTALQKHTEGWTGCLAGLEDCLEP